MDYFEMAADLDKAVILNLPFPPSTNNLFINVTKGRIPSARYADWRRWDQRATIGFTDALVRVFANPLPPVRLARNLGLIGFDLLPPLKRLLVRQLMGVAGRQPRLGLGRALAG